MSANREESQTIERKSIWKDECLEEICGFANAEGGTLYLGYADDGSPVGVKSPGRLSEDIPSKIKSTLGISCTVDIVDEGCFKCIKIDVPKFDSGISYRGVYYRRSGSTNQRLDGPALESFLLSKHGTTWDNLPLPSFGIDDVDEKAVRHFAETAVSKGRLSQEALDEQSEVFLKKLGLIRGPYYTNAAALLFGKDPNYWHQGSYIKIGYFITDAEIRYQDEISGPIFEQVEKAIELIYFKYMRANITYEGLERFDKYFVPESALREALCNAVCHKSYQSGIPVQVSVYADKLYIANAGGLPEHWSAKTLMQKHESKPSNPTIARVFYLSGKIETWGRGIEKICDALDKDKRPMPEYTVHPEDVMLKFSAPEGVDIWQSESPQKRKEPRSLAELTTKKALITTILKKHPEYTIPKIAASIGVSEKTVFQWLHELSDQGAIERVGARRNGRWIVKI